MKREEIQERIKVLKKEILDRQIEVDNLNQKLIDSSESFRDKFVIWASRGKAKQLRYLPDGDIRVYADYRGMIEGRGVVNLMEYEDFELYAHPDPASLWGKDKDGEKFAKEEIDRLESNSKFMAACAHMMRDNVGSFAIDW
jgi:hypothetical protein